MTKNSSLNETSNTNKRSLFNDISNKAFLAALVISKGSIIKPPFIGLIFFITSLVLCAIGYITWQLAILAGDKDLEKPPISAKNIRLKYGKEYSSSAIIGLIASIVGLASIGNPPLFAASCWLFLTSNLCWFYAECKVEKRFPFIKSNKAERYTQATYFTYIQLTTYASLLSAIHFTAIALSASFAVMPMGVFLFYFLTATSIFSYIKLGQTVYSSTSHDMDDNEKEAELVKNTSYLNMHQSLDVSSAQLTASIGQTDANHPVLKSHRSCPELYSNKEMTKEESHSSRDDMHFPIPPSFIH